MQHVRKWLSVTFFWGASTLAALAQVAPALQTAAPEQRQELERRIAAAKAEGALVYSDTVLQPETNDALSAAFRRHYGLPASFKISYQLIGVPQFITRIEQEVAADRVSMDVGAVAAPTWLFERAAAGDILEYASPEHRHYRASIDAGLALEGYFVPNGAYVFVPMWSQDHLTFTGKSWKDVINAVPAGRITIGDAPRSATHLATYIGQRAVMDETFFRGLAAMKPQFMMRSEQIAARLAAGEDLMAVSGMPTRAYQLNVKGARLKFMLPEEGVMLHAQSTFIFRKAPHPNAAKLWIDFILSEEGQRILTQGEALISARSGFKSALPDYAPSIDSLKIVKVDWRSMSAAAFEQKREEWRRIFQP